MNKKTIKLLKEWIIKILVIVIVAAMIFTGFIVMFQ